MFLIDQSSLPFIVLLFLLSGICLYLAGTESNTINYITLVLIILILLLVLFLLWNIFIFFIYYEFLVIILFIMLFLFIASFFKVRSAFYFFIFSLFGSIFFFYVIAILPIIIKVVMINSAIIFSLPFLVKLPSFPFSYWLPEVHTEANTSISVILAGLILKLGIFGIMRYCYITFDLFYSIINSGLLTLTLIIILIIMCSFFRFATDLKKIIAFSSIIHLNLTFSALITLNNSGILTAIITSFAHGLSSVALFLFVGSVIARTYSRNIDSLFFLDFQSRIILLFLLLFNLSFPLTLNFIGELMAVVSLISVSFFFAFIFMLSSLVFTLFWFFIYNRKLPYYPIRLHLYSSEKFITIYLCVLLMSSGIFFVSLSPGLSLGTIRSNDGLLKVKRVLSPRGYFNSVSSVYYSKKPYYCKNMSSGCLTEMEYYYWMLAWTLFVVKHGDTPFSEFVKSNEFRAFCLSTGFDLKYLNLLNNVPGPLLCLGYDGLKYYVNEVCSMAQFRCLVEQLDNLDAM